MRADLCSVPLAGGKPGAASDRMQRCSEAS